MRLANRDWLYTLHQWRKCLFLLFTLIKIWQWGRKKALHFQHQELDAFKAEKRKLWDFLEVKTPSVCNPLSLAHKSQHKFRKRKITILFPSVLFLGFSAGNSKIVYYCTLYIYLDQNVCCFLFLQLMSHLCSTAVYRAKEINLGTLDRTRIDARGSRSYVLQVVWNFGKICINTWVCIGSKIG